jgi:tRNA G18 (ribose-2'-O)-methylase SpoU
MARTQEHSLDELLETNGDECEMTQQQGSENVGCARTVADGRKTRVNKRKRWEAKQTRLDESKSREDERETWMSENAHYCTHVSTDDVARSKTAGSTVSPNGERSSHSFVESLLRPYVDLKDGPKQIGPSDEALFIAEGTETVRLLIQQSERENAVKVKSIFVKPATLFDEPVKLLTDIARASELHSSRKRAKRNSTDTTVEIGVEQSSPPFRLLVAKEQVMSEVAGFHIARGALACGVVPRRDEAWLNMFLSNKINSRLLALDGVSDSANMGAMIRCAAAFEIDAIILSHDCCDAWYRRSVRVSMGHIFHVPVVRVDDLASTLRRLAATSYAAVIDRDADLVLEEIARGDVSHSWCCVMGNEGNGISPPVVQTCTHRLRIDMAPGVDSLSVPIAAGILLHGLKEREARDAALTDKNC